jgi:hypothetical protein
MITATTEPGNVPLPAGATKVYDWCDVGSRDAFRDFEGTSWIIDRDEYDSRLEVVVLGSQLAATGQVDGLHIKVYSDGFELTAARAVELARALIAASAELDGLEGTR